MTASSDGPGHGSELAVRLPLSQPAPAPAEKPAPPPATPTAAGLRVLVVDDNVDAALSLGALIELSGHEVQLAHDGSAAIAAARSSAPDLVLLDIGLPGMNGYEVAAQLRQAGLARAVLVAVTGYGRAEDIDRARKAGFDHHLTKPVDIDAVEAIAAKIAVDSSPPSAPTAR